MQNNKNLNKLPKEVEAYFSKHGKIEHHVYPNKKAKYNFIIVVPSIAEHGNLLFLLKSIKYLKITDGIKPLILFVINNADDANDAIRKNNKLTEIFLKDVIIEETFEKSKIEIGFIDAFSSGKEIPAKFAGAGAARKIGMDLALTLFDYSQPGKKIIACTDADCIIESNYITSIQKYFKKQNCSAAVINFEHRLSKDDEINRAIINYEIFLRYYILGLKFAGSKFAYHSVGSTMVCDSNIYIKAGGMNRKKAGEDFYFLQKLAKLTEIHSINKTTVFPSSRPSWRVPFGTGQRVNRYLSHERNEYQLFDPKSFIILKDWLSLWNSAKGETPVKLLSKAEKISIELRKFLELNDFASNWEKIKENSKTGDQLNRQKHTWFDGFKTMKLIHFIRDNAYPEIPMFDAVDKLFKLTKIKSELQHFENIPPIPLQIDYLAILRKST